MLICKDIMHINCSSECLANRFHQCPTTCNVFPQLLGGYHSVHYTMCSIYVRISKFNIYLRPRGGLIEFIDMFMKSRDNKMIILC